MKNNIKKNWCIIIYSVFLLVIYLLPIGSLDGVIFGDELGYWGTAAHLNGKDWSSVLSSLSYYSYGYSIWLAFLMRIGLSYQLLYRSAIILNVLFNLCSFYLACSVGKKIFKNQSQLLIISVAFVISLYSGNIALSLCNWPETLLIMLFWISIKLLIDILEKASTWKISLFLLTILYSFIMHQRFLGVLISGILVILVLFAVKKIKVKQIVYASLFCTLCYVGHLYLKELVIQQVFLDNSLIKVNDFSGTSSIISKFLSLTGLKNFLVSISGKIYYIAISTCFLGFCGIWVIAKQFIRQILNIIKRNFCGCNEFIFTGYLIMSLLSSLVIAALFLLEPPNRGYLFYGRYVEVIMGPIIMIGIWFIMETMRWKSVYIVNTVLALILCFSLKDSLQRIEPNMGGVWTVGMTPFLSGQTKEFTVVFWVLGIVGSIFLAVLVLSCVRRNISIKRKYAYKLPTISIILLLGSYWCFAGNSVTYSWTIPKQKEISEDLELIENFVEQVNWKGTIAVDDELLPLSLQFRLPNNKIVFADSEEAEIVDIIYAKSLPRNMRADEFDAITMPRNEYAIFIRKDINMSIELNDFKYRIDMDHMSLTDVSQGYIAFGPYITLPRADYEVTFELEGVFTQDTVGVCDVSAQSGEVILESVELKSDMFHEGKLSLKIPFTLYQKTDNIEFRVQTYDGSKIKLKQLFYRKDTQQYTLGQDTTLEMDKIVADIKQGGQFKEILYLNELDESVLFGNMCSLLPEYSFSSVDKAYIKEKYPQAYVIADRRFTSWMELIGNFEIVNLYENYILLKSNGNTELQYVPEYVNLDFLQKKVGDGVYYYQHYDLKDAGEYEVELQLMETPEGQFSVEVYNGKQMIDKFDVINGGENIGIKFSSLGDIRDLSFYLYSEAEQRIINYESGKIRKIRNGITYANDITLMPLLEIANKMFDTSETIMVASLWNELSQNQLTTYLNNYTSKLRFVEYNDETREIPRKQWMILPFDARIVYSFLDDYVVAGRTNRYVLMVCKEKSSDVELAGGELLSNERWLNTRFFEILSNERIYKSAINLSPGTYDVEVTLKNKLFKEGGEVRFEVLSSGKPFKSVALSEGTNSVEISNKHNIMNLTFRVLEEDPGLVNYQITGIRKISNAYQIDLSQMQFFAGNYCEEEGTITTSGDIIYGPYTSLEEGKYKVSFQYNSENAQYITFDVVINQGEILCPPESVQYEKVENDFVATFIIETIDNLEQVEFRTHVPEGLSCKLKSIMIEPIN